MSITKLSENEEALRGYGPALVMVGSFAPVHNGHLEAVKAAELAIRQRGENVSGIVFSPNSDSYVTDVKLKDKTGRWAFGNRVLEFLQIESSFNVPAFVDDLSGVSPPEGSITDSVIQTIDQHLGVRACDVILVCGSDQVKSMRPHIDNSRAVCVLRPGSEEMIAEQYEKKWFRKSVANGQYILTHRENSIDISSTEVRAKLADIAISSGDYGD